MVDLFLVNKKAIGLTGIGWGFIMGASLKDIVYLIYDDFTLNSMAGDIGFKLGTQTEAALGTWGRTAEATINVSNKGVGSNIALSYSKGIFGGLSIEVSFCGKQFYQENNVSSANF
jgi:lipid-binding SYLF domain-containing protein